MSKSQRAVISLREQVEKSEEVGLDVNTMVVLLSCVSAKSCRATGGNVVHLAKGWWQTPRLDDSEACCESPQNR